MTADRTIHGAVGHRAARQGAAIAVVDGETRLSYAELDRRSDEVAGALAAAGVPAGSLVPVLLPRGADLVVTLLGILKSGCAYACLSSRWPAERMLAVLEQLDAVVLITADPGALPDWGGRRLSPAEAAGHVRGPLPAVRPEEPAMVFFTSGTTGTPKGVVSPHCATTRMFQGADRLPGFDESTMMAQTAPSAWDLFSLEVWGILITGGTLVIADDYFMPYDLTRLRDAEGVNLMWLTASLFNLFVDTEPESLAGLHHLYIGGERLSVEHVRRFLQHNPDVALLNGYGPVESCVFATTHRIRPADCDVPGGIPIGRPVRGTAVHVLADGRPCGPGEQGELYLAGEGLALGYLGNPVLTAEKFPELVLDGHPTRLYATGDRGHRDAEGVLHFAGRADRQVKMRGHRLELAEIELAAAALPEVEQCVVLPVVDAAGSVDRLALVYTDPKGAVDGPLTAPEISALKRALRDRLPGYAVPNLIARVPDFPLTPNGKLDSARLLGEVLAAS